MTTASITAALPTVAPSVVPVEVFARSSSVGHAPGVLTHSRGIFTSGYNV